MLLQYRSYIAATFHLQQTKSMGPKGCDIAYRNLIAAISLVAGIRAEGKDDQFA